MPPNRRGVRGVSLAGEAPARFLVGGGMEAAGADRGLPYPGALD